MRTVATLKTKYEEHAFGTYRVFVSKPHTSFHDSHYSRDMRSPIFTESVSIFVSKAHAFLREATRLLETISRTFINNLPRHSQHYRFINTL